jgi:hypothetical protein
MFVSDGAKGEFVSRAARYFLGLWIRAEGN